MKKAQSQKKKEVYTKPELFTHDPLRNITADGPNGNPPPVTPGF